MSTLVTLIIGGIGGAIAFFLGLPVPWLVGSLLIMLPCRRLSFISSPGKLLSRWMRVVLGVALGASVAVSWHSFDTAFLSLLFIVILFVCVITIFGCYYFRRLPAFTGVDSFMSSLPGGLTFLMSLSDNLGDRLPRIALIHTIRMVFLILCFSVFALAAGVDEVVSPISSSFMFPLDFSLWQVLAFTVAMGLLSDRLNIAGGHIMFPMIASAIFYSQGWIKVPVPEVFQTLAMITFGVGIGCKLNNVSLLEFKPFVKASVIFTVFAMVIALVIAIALSQVFDAHYFLFFLALAPGSIAEISLIALSLGFDVGLVAAVHTCRYLFIMLLGSYGLSVLTAKETTHEDSKELSV